MFKLRGCVEGEGVDESRKGSQGTESFSITIPDLQTHGGGCVFKYTILGFELLLP